MKKRENPKDCYKRKKADGTFQWWGRLEYTPKGGTRTVYQENLGVIGTAAQPNIKAAEKQYAFFKVRSIQHGNKGPAVNAGTFGGLKQDFFNYLKAPHGRKGKRCRESTLRTYAWAWAELEPHFGNVPLAEIDTLKVKTFIQKAAGIDWTKGKGRTNGEAKGSTVNMLTKVLRCALKYAKDQKKISEVPEFMELEAHERKFVITPEIEAQLMDVAPLWMRQYLMFIDDMGLRVNEAVALQWKEHINFKANIVHVVAQTSGEVKSDAGVRDLPMTARVRTILETRKQFAQSNYVWTSPTDPKAPLTDSTVQAAMRRMREQAGINNSDCVSHAGRHTYLTRLAKHVKGNVKLFMQLSGHSDMRTALRYVHPDDSEKQAAVQAMEAYPMPASTGKPLQASAAAND